MRGLLPRQAAGLATRRRGGGGAGGCGMAGLRTVHPLGGLLGGSIKGGRGRKAPLRRPGFSGKARRRAASSPTPPRMPALPPASRTAASSNRRALRRGRVPPTLPTVPLIQICVHLRYNPLRDRHHFMGRARVLSRHDRRYAFSIREPFLAGADVASGLSSCPFAPGHAGRLGGGGEVAGPNARVPPIGRPPHSPGFRPSQAGQPGVGGAAGADRWRPDWRLLPPPAEIGIGIERASQQVALQLGYASIKLFDHFGAYALRDGIERVDMAAAPCF